MNKKDRCPICGCKSVGGCKCIRNHQTCANNHSWHTCVIHNKIVLGQPDHSLSTNVCTCIKGLTKEEELVNGLQFQLEDALMNIPYNKRIETLIQLFVDLMDHHEQSPEEEFFVQTYAFMKKFDNQTETQ